MRLSLGKRPVVVIATGGYVGYLPVAPGTAGSIIGLFLGWLLSTQDVCTQVAVIVALLALGIWTSGWTEEWLGTKDHSAIVIDEIVGMVLALFMLPFESIYVLSAFVAFRALDILKPIAALERLPGGWGIMCDDIAAGCMANMMVHGVRFFLT